MSYDRATVDTNQSQSLRKRIYDTLQSTWTQSVETVVRQSRFEISGGGVDQVDAPDDLDELVDLAKDVGFVWKAFNVFADEVWKPGYRLEGPDETVGYFMGGDDAPEETPEGGFLKNCGVYAGEKRQDFYDVGKEATFQRRLRGTVLVEYLKKEEENPESEITGFYFIRPETVSAEVYPHTNILIDPDDTDIDGVEVTKRGEAAAYIQFDDNSIIGRRSGKFSGVDEIPLSQNDVMKQVLNPGIGDDASAEQGVFGTSELEPISEDIAEYKQIKRDRATAIGNKAHGIWLIEHGRDVLDLGNQIEVVEWDDDSMQDFETALENVGPGGYVTHDGSVTPERIDGDVPDLSSTIQNYIDDIFSGLPVSKYKVGFEDNINRDVTSEQSDSDEDLIQEEREYQERQWTKALRTVANRKGLPTDGLELKIEPEPEDSPVLSLSKDEIEKLQMYASALDSLAGPTAGPQTLVDSETLLTEIAQLPEEAADMELEEMDADEETEALFADMVGMDTLAQYSEGDEVDTPDGVGVIVEIRTESFEGPDGEIEATSDSPTYVVGTEDGVGFFSASEIESATIEVEDVDTPEDTLQAIADIEDGVDTLQKGVFNYPDSWEKSPTPNRIILLKAWAGLGGRFTTCKRKMTGEVSRPNAFCADMKDRVLGGWEGWRQGG